MTEGVKHDYGKARFSLLPVGPLREVVDVLTFGATKYSPENWKYVSQAEERYSDAVLRHLFSWIEGEKIDPESGKSHLAHAMCCLLFLLWFEQESRQ